MSDFNTTMFRMLGERLKQVRLNNNLNQEAVAREIGLDRTSISNIEVGRHQPSLAILYQLSNFFKTDIHALVPSYHEVAARLTAEEIDDIAVKLESMTLSPGAKDSISKILNTI